QTNNLSDISVKMGNARTVTNIDGHYYDGLPLRSYAFQHGPRKSNTRRNIKILKPRGKSQGIEMKPVIVLITVGIAAFLLYKWVMPRPLFRMGACRITGDLVRDEDNDEVLSTRLKRQY